LLLKVPNFLQGSVATHSSFGCIFKMTIANFLQFYGVKILQKWSAFGKVTDEYSGTFLAHSGHGTVFFSHPMWVQYTMYQEINRVSAILAVSLQAVTPVITDKVRNCVCI